MNITIWLTTWQITNQARSQSPIEINPTKIPDSLMTPLWDSLGPIDRDVRKFSQHVTECFTFDIF